MTNSQQPPEQRSAFTPPFCPNRECRFHLNGGPEWRWVRNGRYVRRSDGQAFQGYRCRTCGRRFSTRTFCTDYWLRRRDLFPKIGSLVSNGMGLRQAARDRGTTHATIARHLARLGRHCLLLHQELVRDLQLHEVIVIDGFESFEYSQYFPFHLNLAVGSRSWFVYDLTDSPLRRKGRMTAEQLLRREALEAEFGRPDPKAVEKAIATLVEGLRARVPKGETLRLYSDEHKAYPRALNRLRREDPEGAAIEQRVISSKAPRTYLNPLFPVNLADLLLRHCHANHKRETIAFSKRRMAAILRAMIFLVWRNCIKKRREKAKKSEPFTAAMIAGVTTEPWTWDRVLATRLFPDRLPLEEWRWTYYREEVMTVVLEDRQRTHKLKRAF